MTNRYCGDCGSRLQSTTSRGGVPHRVCPNCTDDGFGVISGP